MKSYKRHDPSPLMANPEGTARGPNGRVLCRWCGTEVAPPRRCWCSDECVHEYSIRKNPRYARRHLHLRDKGVCALCGRNASKLRGRLKRMPYVCRASFHAILRLPRGFSSSLWEADHVVPVSEGGGSCGLDNLRTLCLWCHRCVTRELRARLAQRRRRRAKGSNGRLKDRARGL